MLIKLMFAFCRQKTAHFRPIFRGAINNFRMLAGFPAGKHVGTRLWLKTIDCHMNTCYSRKHVSANHTTAK